MNKSEIIACLRDEISATEKALSQTGNEAFFKKPDSKWSIAENAQHLVLSARPLNLAFSLPKISYRILFGKPYRKSYPYDEIVKRYKQLLTDGAVATGAYVPRRVPLKGDKSKIVSRFSSTHQTLLSKISQFNEEELDNYFLPHPLLGKLTVREMLYFTAYHIGHHRNAINPG
jgi:hypothetical protein